jgi:hypothetical protein
MTHQVDANLVVALLSLVMALVAFTVNAVSAYNAIRGFRRIK